jgi:hypothetical protein
MGTMLAALVIMLLVIAGMAIGVIFGRAPLKGSCGGVGKALGEKDYVCDVCGGDESKCDEKQGTMDNSKRELAYEVTEKSQNKRD